ncbi:MAG: ABC transporter permease, partial [Candidatus Latescibacteria bacterium]|nr:ABC transporter permease [Candidatus Latescibacterota bacterium]
MFRNYLTVAVRNLVRHKVYSFINISGLAIGIAFCILTLLYVRHEWSYDTFHQNSDRIYLTRYVYEPSGNRTPTGSTPPILAPTVLENFPEIQRVVRVYGWGIKDGTPVRYGEKLFNRSGYYVDPPFFEMFSFPRVSGNLRTALQNIHSVVISREMARMYFEDENPLDKRVSIRIREKLEDFVVTGVVDIPENSSLQFDFLLSYELKGKPSSGWGQCNVYTYIQLVNPMQAADLERKFPSFVEKYIPAATQRAFGGDQGIQLQLMPLPDLYLNTVIREWLTAQSNPVYSYIFSGIALAVLLIACVNFMNLSVGLSSTRFKEVGMRKVVGATRTHLMRQFFGESILLSVLALLVGAAFAELALPTFNALVGRNLSMDYGSDWLALLGLVLIVGLAAGSYPALVLSGFHPVEVLKGRLRIGGTSRFSRV